MLVMAHLSFPADFHLDPFAVTWSLEGKEGPNRAPNELGHEQRICSGCPVAELQLLQVVSRTAASTRSDLLTNSTLQSLLGGCCSLLGSIDLDGLIAYLIFLVPFSRTHPTSHPRTAVRGARWSDGCSSVARSTAQKASQRRSAGRAGRGGCPFWFSAIGDRKRRRTLRVTKAPVMK